MRYVRPFHVLDRRQFSLDWANSGRVSEAVCFDRDDILDVDNWNLLCANLRFAAQHGPVTFHFPVNNASYVEDPAVQNQLWRVFDLMHDLGALGLVLHSNMTERVEHWTPTTVKSTKSRFHEFLQVLSSRGNGRSYWIGLENMPIMGNAFDELDPVLIYPSDFRQVAQHGLEVTWDLCHYSYTKAVTRQLLTTDTTDRRYYPHLQSCVTNDQLLEIRGSLVHAHLGAFRGVADRHGGRCKEGVLPTESSLGEEGYRQDWIFFTSHFPELTVSLEVNEVDYLKRVRFPAMLTWAKTHGRRLSLR